MWIGMFIVIFFIHEISISRDYLVSTQNTLRTAKGLEHFNTAWLCSGLSILNLQPGDVPQHKDANMYYTIKHYTSSLTIITYLLFCQKNSMNWNEFKKKCIKRQRIVQALIKYEVLINKLHILLKSVSLNDIPINSIPKLIHDSNSVI